MYDTNDPARGERLASLRRASLMSQAALAAAAGVHVATVKRAEAGKPMSPETAQALCSVLRAGAADLAAPPAAGDACDTAATTAPPAADHCPTVRGRKRGRRRLVALAGLCAALGCWLQVRAWDPPDTCDLFRVWQAASQTALAAAVLALAIAVRPARRGWPVMAFKSMMVAVGVAAVAWPAVALAIGLNATASDLVSGLREYSRLTGIIRVRRAMEPGWDPSRAHWVAMRRLYHLMAHETAHIRTPGTLSWHEDRMRACPELFLHAEHYPGDVCDPVGTVIAPRDLGQLGRSLTGASLVPSFENDPKANEVLFDPGFAAARAIVEAHGFDVGEALREAGAYAAARRDRRGPGG